MTLLKSSYEFKCAGVLEPRSVRSRFSVSVSLSETHAWPRGQLEADVRRTEVVLKSLGLEGAALVATARAVL